MANADHSCLIHGMQDFRKVASKQTKRLPLLKYSTPLPVLSWSHLFQMHGSTLDFNTALTPTSEEPNTEIHCDSNLFSHQIEVPPISTDFFLLFPKQYACDLCHMDTSRKLHKGVIKILLHQITAAPSSKSRTVQKQASEDSLSEEILLKILSSPQVPLTLRHCDTSYELSCRTERSSRGHQGAEFVIDTDK